MNIQTATIMLWIAGLHFFNIAGTDGSIGALAVGTAQILIAMVLWIFSENEDMS